MLSLKLRRPVGYKEIEQGPQNFYEEVLMLLSNVLTEVGFIMYQKLPSILAMPATC